MYSGEWQCNLFHPISNLLTDTANKPQIKNTWLRDCLSRASFVYKNRPSVLQTLYFHDYLLARYLIHFLPYVINSSNLRALQTVELATSWQIWVILRQEFTRILGFQIIVDLVDVFCPPLGSIFLLLIFYIFVYTLSTQSPHCFSMFSNSQMFTRECLQAKTKCGGQRTVAKLSLGRRSKTQKSGASRIFITPKSIITITIYKINSKYTN